MNIIYRDLKPENILIDNAGHVKLIDFGFSKLLKNIKKDRARTICGTQGYNAPEVIMGHGYNYKADIWSIGILICEMIGGYLPFSDENDDSSMGMLERI
jgi:serine/threonine protein kinase